VGGTVIDELDCDLGESGLGLTLAAALVACAALVLVSVPIVIALFQPEVPLPWVGGVAGGVGAALGGVKLVALGWAAGARLMRPHPVTTTVAFAD
jgi:hypothetical protein